MEGTVTELKRLLVGGNICSGKSTLCRKLSSELSIDLLSIDDFRRKFGNGKSSGEARVWTEFLLAIEEADTSIIEATSGGPFTHLLRHTLSSESDEFGYLFLDANVDTCSARLFLRGFNTPYPDFGVDNFTVQKNISIELKSMFESEFWGSRSMRIDANTTIESLQDIALEQLRAKGWVR